MAFSFAPALAARPRDGHRTIGFLLIYAAAYTGGVMGYLPLLTLLLPIKIEAVAGGGRLGLFAATVIGGVADAGHWRELLDMGFAPLVFAGIDTDLLAGVINQRADEWRARMADA